MARYSGRYNEDGFTEYLQELVNAELIGPEALGITKKVIDDGVASLSLKQKIVFEQHVMNTYYVDECDVHGGEITWNEMFQALDSGCCGECAHGMERLQMDQD